ncbi:MAG: hypothetical protein ACD_26C00034G0100 [uncultured bacterium]|nr:MAG: hypothetical protein ACD_26C00034G0100 [uncultured bacterium]
MKLQKISKFIVLVLITIIPTLLIWLPFFARVQKFWNIPLSNQGMATIVSNFDGPLYIVAAKTMYNPELIGKDYQFPLTNEYYSAHFPMFPLLIKVFSPILGNPYSMLLVTITSSLLALYFFYKHAREYLSSNNSLWLTFVFAIFPARWLIVRSVGSPEPFFIAAILASTYFFGKGKYLLAGLWGLLAQVTKSPAILLFIAYILQIFISNFKDIKKIELKKYIPLLLIPFGVFLVFGLYKLTYGNFWVYFKSGDNMHLFFPPFQIFNYSATWVGTFWLEEVIFIYLIGILGLYKLYQEKMMTYFYFSLIFFIPLLFVAHRDLMRYSLPLVPFFLLGFRDLIVKTEFKVAIAVLLIPIYLYSLAFISQNAMPIANWAPFL